MEERNRSDCGFNKMVWSQRKEMERVSKKYREQLKENALTSRLKIMAKNKNLTLVYSTKNEEHNNAIVLKKFLDI